MTDFKVGDRVRVVRSAPDAKYPLHQYWIDRQGVVCRNLPYDGGYIRVTIDGCQDGDVSLFPEELELVEACTVSTNDAASAS